ncbi:MAG: S53 family peptidase [Rhodospirillales bacterium]
MTHTILAGSVRATMPGALVIGKADPAERLEVTVLVRRQASAELAARVGELARPDAPAKHLSREEFAQHHGASSADFAAVKKFAVAHGLSVVQQDAARRTIVLAGTVAQFSDAFEVELQQFEHEGGTYRGRTGPIHVPNELAGTVEAVLGLDDRPAARPHLRGLNGSAAPAAATAFTPSQIARLYGFPAGTGAGQCIAIIELGGGYRPRDLRTYFNQLGVAPPRVTAISVDNAHNHPTGSAAGPDGEVMLDIEVAGAVAPAAHLAVYFAPNTDSGFLNAITTAVHDAVNKPSVISISWGGPEASWTAQSLNAYDQAFQDAAALGVTVLAAAGDNGASDGLNDGKFHVDFPASSPHVTACGGTNIQAHGTTILSETVWNDGPHGGAGGGGVSSYFATPSWQVSLRTKDLRRHDGTVAEARRARCRRQCRSGQRLSRARGRPEPGVRGHQRGGAAVGGADCADQSGEGQFARPDKSEALCQSAGADRHRAWRQRWLRGAGGGWDACTGLGSPRGTALAAVL